MAAETGVGRSPLRAVITDLPVVTWLLLAAALATAVADAMAYSELFPVMTMSLGKFFGIVEAARAFLLAGALVAGMSAWPAGRRWLFGAAGLFAVSGLLDLGFYAWLWSRGGLQGVGEALIPLLPLINARAFLSGALLVSATSFVGVGLWRARPSANRPGSVWTGTIVAIGAIGILAATGNLVALARTPAPLSLEGVLSTVIASADDLALTTVGIAAVTALPAYAWFPEVTVAVGAALSVVTGAWVTWVGLIAGGMQNVPQDWIGLAVALPSRLGVIGMLLMVVGLAMGHLVVDAGADTGSVLAQDEGLT